MKRFLSLLTVIAFVGITNVWGDTTETSTFTSKNLAVGTNEPAWTGSAGSNSNNNEFTSSGRGVQYLATNGVSKDFTSTAFQNKIIKSVSAVVSRNKANYPVSISVTVNGNTLGDGGTTTQSQPNNESISTSDNTGINCGNGNIVVTISTGGPSSSAKSMYVKSISVTYSTATCSNKLNLTKSVSGNGSFSVHQGTATGTEVENSGSIDNCGDGTTTLVVVPTPTNDDYYCSAVTASGSEDVEEDSDGNWVITYNQGSTINTTVTATFSTVPSYDVTWTANGGEHAKTSVKKGNKPTFPATPVSTDAKSKQFVGWATSTWDTPLDDVSSKTIYTYGDAMPAVNGEVEYFAVWAKSTDTYAIMEYGDELTDGNYVFAAYVSPDDYAMGNTVSSNMIAGTYISVANDEIEEPNAQFIWKLSHIDDTYVSLYNAAATKDHYLGLTSSGLTLEANPSTNGQFNPVLSNTYNLATIALKSKSQSGKEIQYYQGKFKSYTSQSSDIYIYKEILEKYITTCASCNVSPSLGNPTLTSIASGKITVECPSIGAGSAACEITDYGFIWKKGSAPTMESKDGIESTGTNDQSSAYNDDLTIDVANNTGSTYYIKAYATNGNGTTLSSALEVTPQSVTFNMNGHGSQVATQYVNNGGTATDPGTTSITGYTFNGWKLNSSAYSFSSAVTSDITLVADWSVKSHTLTWTTSGDALTGDYTGKSGDVDYGTTIVAPNTPTKTGYTFAAWTPAVAATMPDNDLTYTATWTAKTTAITLNKNNEDAEGSNAGSASWTYDQTTKNSCSTATRTGYTVEGYYTAASGGTKILNADGSLAGNAITVDEVVYTNDGKWAYNGTELTLYAHWTANTYKVVFKANGGTGDDVEQTGFTYDESKTLTSLETIGFTAPEHKYFLGWNTNSSATTATYADEASVSNLSSANNGSVNLYAIWKEHTYTNYRTLCCTPLAAPASIAVSVTGAATATVTWDPVADATGYEYKLGDGDWTTASVTGTEIKTLSLSGLTGASDYTIYVRTNGDGDNCTEGTASAGTNFRTYSTVTAAVNDALMGTAKVSLNNSDWSTSVEAADETIIYLQATPGSLYEFSNWATPASGTISSNQLTGWSGDVIVTANFVAKELTKLDTPTGMGLVGEPTATSATIKWNVVDHASGYQVVCAGATIGDVTVTDGVASCPLTYLTANTAYNWTVKALGDGVSFEDGDACDSQSFTTDKKKPTAIEITHAPTLTEYLEGQSFATAGMVVKVTYNNGDIDGAYTDYSIDPSGALEYGTTYVTVTATLNGQSRSTTQAITVHKKYTLTFKNNGSIVETRDLKEGDAYGAFPDEGDACDGTSTTFMGWSTAEISEKQAAAPAAGYASPTDVMGTSNVVLNAVWAKQTGSERYDLVSTLTANKTYIFVSSNAAGSASALNATGISTNTGSGVKAPATSVTISSGTPVYISTLNTNLEFAYDGTDFQIVGTLAADVDWKYLYINGNGISRRTDKRAYWNDDKGVYGHTNKTPYTYHYIYLNGSEFDRTTSPTSTNRVYAFEKQEASYTDYLTTCCDEWSVTASYGESNTINVGDDALAVTLSDVAYGAASYESSDEAVLTVAADGKITGVKAGSATVTIAWAGIPGSKCAFETSVDVTVNGPITVTYNANDGSLAPATKTHSGTISSNSAFALEANTFSRTGYTFQGWATTPSGAKAYDNSQANVSFAEDVTLYAVWAINSHAVTLTQPTGNTITANSSTTPGNVTYGTTVTLTATENETASDGYVFTGWTVDGATVVDASAKETTFTMPDNAVSVSATYTHYTWDLTGYTVTTAPKIEYYKVEKFSTAGVVIKENYKRSDNEETKQETYAGTWTAKLNGVAIANGADLSLDDNGKTLKLYIGEEEIASYTLTVNNIDVDQFVVGIWDIEAPTFQINTYTMPSLSNQTAGDAATCKDHNIFIGWTTDPDDPKDANIIAGGTEGIVASNTTYYAVWAKNGTITDDVEKNSIGGTETSATLNAAISYSTGLGGGTSAVGVYDHKIRLYQNSAGGYGGFIKFTASTGYKIKAITLTTSTGSEFGYELQSDFEASQMTPGAISNHTIQLTNLTASNVIIAAKGNTQSDRLNISAMSVTYETTGPTDYIVDCEARYEIQFDANGGTGSYDPIKKAADKTIELPSGSLLSKEYHNFAGWKIGATPYEAGDTYTVNGEDAVENIITVTAQWDPFSQGAVTVDGEALEGSPFYATQSYTLPTPDAISGKKFIGWSNGEIIVAPGEYTMSDPADNITYTSQWFDLLPTPSGVSFTDGEWILVTAQEQLHAGDFIVVAAANADYAMGAEASGGKNRTPRAVTKSGNTLSYASEVMPLFLQNGYGANQYALYDMGAEMYLYAASSSDNHLKIAEDFDQNGSWLITIANGSTSVMAQGANTHNDLRYNAGGSIINSVFSCYAEGGQQPIALYRWIETIKTEGNVNASDVMPTYNVNLVVQTNTSIDMNVERTVNDFIIEAMEGESGQVKNPENLNINGNAYYDLTLNTSGTMDNSKWYAFAVPFQVDAATGIQRLSNDGKTSNAGFNSHYVLLKYNSEAYASSGQGWEYVTRGETLMPGKFYMIALNSNEYNRVRMTKKAGTPVNNKADLTLSTVGTGIHANWNALANNALAYANVSATGLNADLKVQVYKSAEDSYAAYEYGKVTFTVGTPFFIQVAEAGTMNVDIAATYNENVKAPARYAVSTEEFQIRLGENTESYFDLLYVSASDEALNEYQIGHDLSKAGVSTTVPQMYVPAYGAKLCDAEFPLVNNEATFPLTFSAPNAGTYQLYVAKAAKDAELYLTLDGNIIWNLSMSACEVELTKGLNEGYGLKLVVKAPQTPTGVEDVQMNDVQCTKMIIDEKVFILRGGKMYDVTGKAVR